MKILTLRAIFVKEVKDEKEAKEIFENWKKKFKGIETYYWVEEKVSDKILGKDENTKSL